MKEILVEVLGAEPQCSSCTRAKKIVEDTTSKLKDVQVKVLKVNIASPEILRKYGVLTPPTIIINGAVKIKGRVPSGRRLRDSYTRQ